MDIEKELKDMQQVEEPNDSEISADLILMENMERAKSEEKAKRKEEKKRKRPGCWSYMRQKYCQIGRVMQKRGGLRQTGKGRTRKTAQRQHSDHRGLWF